MRDYKLLKKMKENSPKKTPSPIFMFEDTRKNKMRKKEREREREMNIERVRVPNKVSSGGSKGIKVSE